MAEELHIPVQPITPFKVVINSGEFLLCELKCDNVQVEIQQQSFTIDFYVLNIKGSYMVLGFQWLETLVSVLIDYIRRGSWNSNMLETR